MTRRTLTFSINEDQQGPVAFENLEGLFFPAVSLNRNVQVRAQSGSLEQGVTSPARGRGDLAVTAELLLSSRSRRVLVQHWWRGRS